MRFQYLLLPVILIGGIAAHAEMLTGTVVRSADGDTITVLDADHNQHRIRLAGIGAGEGSTVRTTIEAEHVGVPESVGRGG